MSFSSNRVGMRGVDPSRRHFVKLAVFSGLAVFSPGSVLAAIGDSRAPERSLSLYNPNTRESLDTVYWENGNYVPKALAEIDHIMRDRRTGEIKSIDPRLLDLLCSIRTELNTQRPFHIISGYRSPETNALLRRCGKGAARKSFHLQGKAVDIRLAGWRLSALRRTAYKLKKGGVGYYPCSRFVHVDVGPVRYWSGSRRRKTKK
jgi:uncharacterized protein YcbK (DUF882 family)